MSHKVSRHWVQTLITFVVFGAVVLWAAASHHEGFNKVSGLFLGLYYIMLSFLILSYLAIAAFPQKQRYHRAARGTVLVIIPVFDEEQDAVHAAVRSALSQKGVPTPDVVVVDDGSPDEVAPYNHPHVTWVRQTNTGKRGAQAKALSVVTSSYDFVLTLDSDSQLHPTALWHLLREMNDPRVQAVTGTVLTRNYRDNLLTRLADMNLFVFCALSRGARSTLGIVNPTSGAMSLYRYAILVDNIKDYVTSGKAGDDRRLCEYALMSGRVVAARGAYVESAMPGTYGKTFKQRLRWGQSGWRFLPWEIINLPRIPLASRLLETCTAVLLPVLYIGLIINIVRHGDMTYLPYAFATAGVFLLAESLFFAVLRPGLSRTERIFAFTLVPFYAAFMLFLVYPAKYWATTKLRQNEHAWGTRGGKALPPSTPRHDDTVPLKVFFDPYSTITTELPLPEARMRHRD